jgi:ArsR family transcriptional regulator
MYTAGVATATRLDLDRAARLFQALSDPTRLRLMQTLRKGERCVCDLMDATDAAQSRVSFHLKVLKDAGLILDRRAGRWVHYRIDPDTMAEVEGLLGQLEPDANTVASCDC